MSFGKGLKQFQDCFFMEGSLGSSFTQTLAAKATEVMNGSLTLSQTTNFRLFLTERVCR